MSRQFAGSSVDPVTDAEVWASAVDAAERLIRRQNPTADAAANRRTSRLEWPTDIDFSRILFSFFSERFSRALAAVRQLSAARQRFNDGTHNCAEQDEQI